MFVNKLELKIANILISHGVRGIANYQAYANYQEQYSKEFLKISKSLNDYEEHEAYEDCLCESEQMNGIIMDLLKTNEVIIKKGTITKKYTLTSNGKKFIWEVEVSKAGEFLKRQTAFKLRSQLIDYLSNLEDWEINILPQKEGIEQYV